MSRSFLVILLSLISTGVASAQTRMPRFSDFPISGVYTGPNAPVVLKQGDDMMFRTRLREASKEKPNFAGHYILTLWGCGTSCVMGAVIDAKTGRVHWWNFTVCCWSADVDEKFEPIAFRRNSSLIVFSGARNEKEDDVGVHFYKFQDGRFVHLRSVLASSAQASGGPPAPDMARWAGQYPDTKFFNQPQLKSSLRRILSKEDYDSISNYNLMTPIVRVGDYLVTNSSIKYAIPDESLNVAFSLTDGAVYVVFWKGDQHRKFSSTNNQFNLPDEVLRELGLKQN